MKKLLGILVLLISIIFFSKEIHDSLSYYKFYRVILSVLPIELKIFARKQMINYSDLEKNSIKNFENSKKKIFRVSKIILKKNIYLTRVKLNLIKLKTKNYLIKLL